MLTVSLIVHDDFSHIHQTLACLFAMPTPPERIFVTINATPSQAEVEQLRTGFPTIHMLINPEPRGFATNHNRVMALAATPFIALLNDDITFPPDALDTLISVLQTQPDVGLVAPAIQSPDGSPQLAVFSDPTLFRSIYKISGAGSLTQHGGLARRFLQRIGLAKRLGVESLNPDQTMRAVPVARGVCMVTWRDVCQRTGGMDEDTRVYGEEYGWHWRIRQGGWRVMFVPQVVITHYNLSQLLEGWKLAEHRKSILNYFIRYRPRWQAWIIRVTIVMFHGLWALLNLPFSRQRVHQHWKAVQIGLWWQPQ
jgi:GT2 family glycosyltransferase